MCLYLDLNYRPVFTNKKILGVKVFKKKDHHLVSMHYGKIFNINKWYISDRTNTLLSGQERAHRRVDQGIHLFGSPNVAKRYIDTKDHVAVLFECYEEHFVGCDVQWYRSQRIIYEMVFTKARPLIIIPRAHLLNPQELADDENNNLELPYWDECDTTHFPSYLNFVNKVQTK